MHENGARRTWPRTAVKVFGFLAVTASLLLAAALMRRSIHRAVKSQAYLTARTAITELRVLRVMYTNKVIRKIVQLPQAHFIRSTSNFEDPNEIPLPNSMVRVVREKTEALLREETPHLSLGIYSRWNIREDAALPKSTGAGQTPEAKGWAYLLAQQEAVRKQSSSDADYQSRMENHAWRDYETVTRVRGRDVLQVVSADPASDQACVNCHNALEEKPEIRARRQRDGITSKVFLRNELMGAYFVQIPIDPGGSIAVLDGIVVRLIALGIGGLLLIAFATSYRRRNP